MAGRIQPEELCREVGRRIAALRKRRGMTQRQLGDRLGTSYQSVSQLEAGRNMTLTSVVRVANALGVGLEDLLLARP